MFFLINKNYNRTYAVFLLSQRSLFINASMNSHQYHPSPQSISFCHSHVCSCNDHPVASLWLVFLSSSRIINSSVFSSRRFTRCSHLTAEPPSAFRPPYHSQSLEGSGGAALGSSLHKQKLIL